MPSATPITVPMTPASRTSTRVLTMRPPIRVVTGTLLASEVPRLPWNRPVSQVQYCATTGRFRCICTSSACSRAGVAVFCSTADAALPGRICVAAKTRMETQNSVITPKPSRLNSMSHIGCALRSGAAAGGTEAAGAGAVTSAMRGRSFRPGQLRAAGGAPGPSRQPEMLEVVGVERQPSLRGDEAVHVRSVSVDDRREERDDQPAVGEVDPLHLAGDLLPLRRVDGGDRFLVELVVGGVVEMRLVERGGGQGRERDLGQVEVVVPVVLREDPFQVARA